MNSQNPLIVELDAFDLQEVALVAAQRLVVKEANNITSLKFDQGQSEFEIHYVGALGEKAVAKFYGSAVDHETYMVRDDGIDMTINRFTTQIKTTTFGGGDPFFFMNSMDCFTAEIGIGVQYLSPIRLRIGGIISRKKFERTAQRKNFGYGVRLAVPFSELAPPDALYLRGIQK